MLDVAVVTPRYPPRSEGGGEKSAQLLATGLADSERVDSVTVFSFDGRERVIEDGVRIVRLGRVSSTVTELQNLIAGNRVRRRLSEFDIVHGYNMELHPALGFLSARYSFPSVGTLNSYHFFSASVVKLDPGLGRQIYELVGHPTTGRILRHYMKQIDAFIALSRAVKEIYVGNGFDGCRIEHITNMADPSFEVPDISDSHDCCRLLYVGALTENKGVEYLIRALTDLAEDYTLRVVGDGDQAPMLRQLARNEDVNERVSFLGRVPYDDLPKVYATADVFVHPGVWPEPLNRTVLEAMQAGLPVVCTDVGGPPEAIPDEELLCPPADPEALAGSIEYASESQGIGKRNREYVGRNHYPDFVVPKILDLYYDLVD